MSTPPIGSLRFRCPLCLRRLRDGESLILFKASSAESELESPATLTVECKQHFMEDVQRFVGKLENNIIAGVFISHVNCDGKNPFLKEGRIQIEGGSGEEGETCTLELMCRVTNKISIVNVRHWIIRMLRETSKYSESHNAMWFPYLLLIATASTDEMNTIRPFGNLIELAGTKDVGKTILTVQLMHEELFSTGLRSFEYFFPRGISGHSFTGELFTFGAWKEQPSFRPPSTESTSGDLRAVFLGRIEDKNSDRPSDEPRKKKGSARKSLMNLFHEFLRLISGSASDAPVVNRATFRIPRRWVPVLFYDSAGESQSELSKRTEKLRNLTNRLAICVNSEEFFNRTKAKTSLRHAGERLEVLFHERDSRLRQTCVVVTKADLLLSRLSKDENEVLKAGIKDTARAKDESRKLLKVLLEKDSTNDTNTLLNYLSMKINGKDLIDEVFFVGTENLPLMQGIRLSPIGSFTPTEAKRGQTVTIKADTKAYRFDNNNDATSEDDGSDRTVLSIKEIRFNGKKAVFSVTDDETIEAIVPEKNSRGFIEIISERRSKLNPLAPILDEANSYMLFNVANVGDQESLKPRSFGLTRFLAWCGGIQESDILKP